MGMSTTAERYLQRRGGKVRHGAINEMLFGISFGYVDQAAAANDLVVGRIPVSGTDTRL
jgi:hypothetical protein